MNTSTDQHIDQCEPGLLFWLVEELLDSQTIDGCGIIFDYLDSRRERITAVSYLRQSLDRYQANCSAGRRNTSVKSSSSS